MIVAVVQKGELVPTDVGRITNMEVITVTDKEKLAGYNVFAVVEVQPGDSEELIASVDRRIRSRFRVVPPIGTAGIVPDRKRYRCIRDAALRSVPRSERMTLEEENLLKCWDIINELREDEPSSVCLINDNPDFNGLPNCAVDVSGTWTDYKEKRFTGDTLLEALNAALSTKKDTEELLAREAQKRDTGE